VAVPPTGLEVLAWWAFWLAICAGSCGALVLLQIPQRSLAGFIAANAVPWLVAGAFLSRRFLRRLNYHHMTTLEDIARIKFRSLLFWPIVYLRLAFTLWVAKVL
jgi:hypothetical protein